MSQPPKRAMASAAVFLRNLAVFSAVSFVAQFVWEAIQSPIFYGGSPPVCILLCAAGGDVMMGAGLYLLLTAAHGEADWMTRPYTRADWGIMVLYGALLSFYIETRALWLNRWHYDAAMPLIPGTPVGLIPVLQLVLLFPAGLGISRWMINRLIGSAHEMDSQS